MKISEILTENTTTLAQLYHGNYPDHDELFWDYVRPNELNLPMNIQMLSAHKLQIILLSQYRIEHLDELFDMMNSDQKDIVEKYMNDANLSNSVIVMSDGRIIDGNHRALAAALKRVSIKFIDLTDLGA